MNILMINHHAGSPDLGMEYRPYYMSREWVKQGHQVTIVASSFSHLRRVQPDCPHLLSEEVKEGIRYIWLAGPRYHGNGSARVLNWLTFLLLLTVFWRRILNNVPLDLVISSSTYVFDNLVAQRIAGSTGALLVHEVRDIWPLSLVELGEVSRFNLMIMAMQWAEDSALRKSVAVISTLPNACEHLEDRGMSRRKFAYVPNGLDPQEWTYGTYLLDLEIDRLLRELKKNGKFILMYAGNFGISNALTTLLDTAALMLESPIAFVVVGNGPERVRMGDKVKSLGLSNVYLLSAISKVEIPSLLSWADVCYIGWARKPIYRFGISPNKLLDYMMAGKPVIHAVDAPGDIVQESGCGISISPDDVDALVNAIQRLMNTSVSEREHLGDLGREFVALRHNYESLSKRFLDHVHEVTENP
jgi:glycosyltransferase involved in cell wall biosynthesis